MVDLLQRPDPVQTSVATPPSWWRESSLPLLTISAGLAGAAEYFLTVRPTVVQLPPDVTAALQPIWPHPGAVGAAIVLFAAAAACFVLATRETAPCDGPIRVL